MSREKIEKKERNSGLAVMLFSIRNIAFGGKNSKRCLQEGINAGFLWKLQFITCSKNIPPKTLLVNTPLDFLR
jgi:hypothetical protein